MRVRAIIPAKGNSKRLKKKNIHEVFGKPMIFWSIDACKNSKYKIEPWVSTEDDKIAEVSKSMGANVVLRDPALCEDHILNKRCCPKNRKIKRSCRYRSILAS